LVALSSQLLDAFPDRRKIVSSTRPRHHSLPIFALICC
jgi:hypothetical protein